MTEEACTKSELDVFRPIDVQVAQTEGKWHVINPVNTLHNNTDVIEFIVAGTSNEMIDLNATSLYLNFKIQQADGTNVEIDDLAAPVNNAFAALFRNCEFSINGQLLTRATREYPYKEFFKRMTQYDVPEGASMKSADRMVGIANDKAGEHETQTATAYVQRATWIIGSKAVEFRGRPCIDLLDTDRLMLPGTDLQFKFYLNDPTFFLTSKKAAPNSFRIEISEAQLHIRRVTVADSFINEINTEIKKKDAIYPFIRRETVALSIPKGTTSYIKENLFRGQLGYNYMFAMVEATAYTGNIKQSPFNFKPFGLTEIALYENGQSVTNTQPIKTNFTNQAKVINAYYTFLESQGAIGDRALTSPIGLDEFCNGYTIFNFTRSPDLTHGETHLPNQTGNLTLQLNFSGTGLAKDVVLVCMAEFTSRIQINQYKNVITDYAV